MKKRTNTFSAVRLLLVLALLLSAVLLITSCSCGKEDCEDGHTWDVGAPTAEDCTKALYTCSVCASTEVRALEGKSHEYQEVTIEATCTQAGSVTKSCKNCKVSSTTPIEASHSLTETVEPATCFANGTKVTTCSKCDYEEKLTILASHAYKSETVTATCVRDGAIVYTCEACGDSYRNVTTRATGHNTEGKKWTSNDVLVSGCLYNHIETTTCNTCNEAVEFTTQINKHSYEVAITSPATCQVAGIKTMSCEHCDDSKDVEFTDAEAHSWDGGVVDGNLTTYSCNNTGCSATKTLYSAKQEVSAQVPSDALQSAGEVELLNATVKLDEEVLKQLEGADVTISAETLEDSLKDALLNAMDESDREKLGDNAIFNFTLSQNGDLVSEFDGKIKVTVPFNLEDGMDPDHIAIWYIDDSGKPSSYPATYTEINGVGYAVFETTHFSYYTVIRMSPEERCELYGHQYDSAVVKPSCNVQGYTIDTCKMCQDTVRHTFTKALTHNYSKTVIAPTCSEKGYSTYNCSNCSDRYVSDFTDKLSHNFETTTVKATCTEKGYTLNKCKACGYAYTENEVSTAEHTFKDGTCTVCGKKTANSGNIYLTAVDSMLNAKSFLINISKLTFSASENDKIVSQTVINNLKAYVKIDALGNLYGVGDANVTQSLSHKDELETQSILAKVLFQDGKMYVYAYNGDAEFNVYGDSNYVPTVAKDYLICVGQEFFLENMFGSSDIVVNEEAVKTIEALWASMLNTKDNPLDKAIAKIIGFIYTQEATDSGYTYKFNPTFAKITYESLKTKKINELFDSVFGEGAYDGTVAFIKGAFSKTIPAIEAEAKTELSKWGISVDTIYTMIDSAMGSETSIKDMIAEMADVQLYMILNQMTESEKTADDYAAFIAQYEEMLKQVTIFDFVMAQAPSEDGAGSEETEEAEDPISNIIDDLIKSFGSASIQFTTTKDGEFISASASFNKFLYNYISENENGELKTTVYIDGSYSFAINESDFTDHSDLIKDQNKIDEFLNIKAPIHPTTTNFKELLGNIGSIVHFYNDIHSIIPSGNDLFVWYYFDTEIEEVISSETVTYNGKECIKALVKVQDLKKIKTDMIMSSTDCVGWKLIELQTERFRGGTVEAYVWYEATEDNFELPLVHNIELVEKDGGYDTYESGSTDFYFSLATKEFSFDSKHTYKVVETVQPSGCEFGYKRYECSACGVSYKNFFGEGHKTETTLKLADGATSCEQGVIVTETCVKCNKVTYESKTNYHRTYEEKNVIKTDSICGDIYLYISKCACGKEYYFYRDDILSDHKFSHTGWDDNYEVYTCAVDGCGVQYKYNSSSRYDYYPDKEQTCWYTMTRTLVINGQTFVCSNTYSSHNNEWIWNEDNTIEYSVCKLCGITLTEYRYDEYGRTIYYRDYTNNYYYTKTFTLCDYVKVEYYSDGDSSTYSGTEHGEYEYVTILNPTCSQYGIQTYSCQLCGDNGGQYPIEPNYWYESYYGYDYHNWDYDEATEEYFCLECGTRSTTGADGMIILEDMASVGELKVGYFNKDEYDMDSDVYFEIILNHGKENSILVEDSLAYMTIEDTTAYSDDDFSDGYIRYRRESGIVTVDLNALQEYINTCEGVETISVVAWVLDYSKTEVGENGEPEAIWFAHALTFELSELY